MKLKTTFLFAFTTIFSFSQHSFYVHPNNRVASLKISQTEYNEWVTNDYFSGVDDDNNPNTPRNYEKIESLSNEIYTYFNDDFDFIFLILNENTIPSTIPYYGKNRPIRNNTLGIGVDNNPLDRGLQHGSPNKLKAILHLTALSYLENGPSLHELLHLWGNMAISAGNAYINPQNNQLISFNSIGHWGFTGHNNFGNGGQLGGFDQSSLIENADGSYTMNSFNQIANGGNSIKYSELELYLMGFLPITDVQPFDVFSNITEYNENGGTITIRGTKTSFNQTTLLQNYGGPRIPSAATAQKDFKALVIVLTPTDLTTNQWNIVDQQAERFSRIGSDDLPNRNNFWEATRGLGTLNVDLSNSVLGNNSFKNEFSLYPNPCNTILNLKTTQTLPSESEIKFTNLIGQDVTNKTIINKTSNSISINVENLSKGIYLLTLLNKNKTILTQKIIIE